MTVMAWVLGSLLLGASLAAFILYGKLNDAERINQALEDSIALHRDDANFWLKQYKARQTQAIRYRNSLTAVVNMRTGKMANVGHRMSAAAAEALKG